MSDFVPPNKLNFKLCLKVSLRPILTIFNEEISLFGDKYDYKSIFGVNSGDIIADLEL